MSGTMHMPPVPVASAELRARTLMARAEALALVPKLQRLVGVLAEAVALAERFPGEVAYDAAADEFWHQSGAAALWAALERLDDLIPGPR
jgi:hypothetical protein